MSLPDVGTHLNDLLSPSIKWCTGSKPRASYSITRSCTITNTPTLVYRNDHFKDIESLYLRMI